MKDFWNQRYAEKTFAYGKLPNQFFKQELDKVQQGSVLLPAEGEGRNAVYAAKKGWEVEAFDFSESAKNKSIELAKNQEVSISYEVANAMDFTTDRAFDVIGLIYAHFPSDIRSKVHQHLIQFLKPKGFVIFEAFSKEQLSKPSGGPKNLEMLFSKTDILNELKGLDFKILSECNIHLKEGKYHKGEATVIRFVGQKL